MSRCFVLFLFLSTCQRGVGDTEEVRPVNVKCAPVLSIELRDRRTLHGVVVTEPDDDIVVASQVAGRLQKVLIREGDVVAKNATIAIVESQPLSDALKIAESQAAQAQATADNANISLQRAKQLFERGISPRQQVDDAHARYLSASSALTATEAQVNVAKSNLQRTHVTTSTDGIVLHVFRRDGELVDGTPTTSIAEIADPNEMEFLATALPSDIMALEPNQGGSLSFDALPGQRFSARVGGVPPAVDPNRGTGTVRLVIPTQHPRPPLGLFGTATVVTGTPRAALVVPPSALRDGWAGASEVVVCDTGRAKIQRVAVGQRETNQVEIREGLKVGDRVVVDNVLGLTAGAVLKEVP